MSIKKLLSGQMRDVETVLFSFGWIKENIANTKEGLIERYPVRERAVGEHYRPTDPTARNAIEAVYLLADEERAVKRLEKVLDKLSGAERRLYVVRYEKSNGDWEIVRTLMPGAWRIHELKSLNYYMICKIAQQLTYFDLCCLRSYIQKST